MNNSMMLDYVALSKCRNVCMCFGNSFSIMITHISYKLFL